MHRCTMSSESDFLQNHFGEVLYLSNIQKLRASFLRFRLPQTSNMFRQATQYLFQTIYNWVNSRVNSRYMMKLYTLKRIVKTASTIWIKWIIMKMLASKLFHFNSRLVAFGEDNYSSCAWSGCTFPDYNRSTQTFTLSLF